MFEITVIENLIDGTLQICSFGVTDEQVDDEVRMLAKNEEQCASVRNWTILSEYQPFNTIEHYHSTPVRTFTP